MATINEKMTALADEVRELSGTTTSKSIDAMTSDVGTANTEVNTQTDLIAQIATALEGKAGGITPSGEIEITENNKTYDVTQYASAKVNIEGGGTSGTVETCTVNVSTNVWSPVIYSTVDSDGSPTTAYTDDDETQHTLNVACGTFLFVPLSAAIPNFSTNDEHVEFLGDKGGYATYKTMVFKIMANAGATITISCWDDD